MLLLTAILRQLVSLREHQHDQGQALAEYGLILALVAVVSIATLTALGLGISGKLDELTSAFG